MYLQFTAGAAGRKNDEGNEWDAGEQRDKRGTIQVQNPQRCRHGRGGFKVEDFRELRSQGMIPN
ncbi:hypothetical protein PAAG_11104 [Paracoccidioides lutzii Pb01]|uniref:Uncharacterized protein n=1 Tax=Paracoccidioides lutzii (strain ATCC MYA-826 / Pb01) TaxID=502779 RepID=A0A0A2V309_PARBA|nr:hypothetical protein PAAG_11104 [Paracoccidioides lutzii Pb01]KGQ02151.1 hypothetical protein PAAG_11104 [Paracoccidioides lutzii Pb01]